jgi:hypothetical protein
MRRRNTNTMPRTIPLPKWIIEHGRRLSPQIAPRQHVGRSHLVRFLVKSFLVTGFGRRPLVAVESIVVDHRRYSKDVCGSPFSISPTILPLPHTPKATGFSRLNQSAHPTSPASCGLSSLSSAASTRLCGCGWHQRPPSSGRKLWRRRGQRPDRYCRDLNGHL